METPGEADLKQPLATSGSILIYYAETEVPGSQAGNRVVKSNTKHL